MLALMRCLAWLCARQPPPPGDADMFAVAGVEPFDLGPSLKPSTTSKESKRALAMSPKHPGLFGVCVEHRFCELHPKLEGSCFAQPAKLSTANTPS